MENWRKNYNEERPHRAIGQNMPIMLLNHVGAAIPQPPAIQSWISEQKPEKSSRRRCEDWSHCS